MPSLVAPASRLDITIEQNAVFPMAICVIERDDAGVATVIDTEGWDALLQVRREPAADSPVLLEASTANGRIIVGITGDPGDEVNIDITIPASDTAALSWFGCAAYDLLVIEPGDRKHYLLRGQAFLQPVYSQED